MKQITLFILTLLYSITAAAQIDTRQLQNAAGQHYGIFSDDNGKHHSDKISNVISIDSAASNAALFTIGDSTIRINAYIQGVGAYAIGSDNQTLTALTSSGDGLSVSIEDGNTLTTTLQNSLAYKNQILTGDRLINHGNSNKLIIGGLNASYSFGSTFLSINSGNLYFGISDGPHIAGTYRISSNLSGTTNTRQLYLRSDEYYFDGFGDGDKLGTQTYILGVNGSGQIVEVEDVGSTIDSVYVDNAVLYITESDETAHSVDISSVAGPQGEQGPQGEKGDTGDTGPQGPQGDTGPQGIQGEKGDTGDTGATGATGATGVGVDTTVNNGDGTFTITYTDATTFTSVDLTGPQGPQGIQGIQGEPGVDGIDGEDGADGADGTSFVIEGQNSNPSAGTCDGTTIGDAYKDTDDNHIWVCTSSGWLDLGDIQGPPGPQGLTGPAGANGTNGTNGTNGSNGADGDGWTSGSYNATTGIVTFFSDDGLGFSTGDLRGADGADGADGAPGTTSWDDLTDIPADIADGDDKGVTSITAGNDLDVSITSGVATIDVDLYEAATKTTMATNDYIVFLDESVTAKDLQKMTLANFKTLVGDGTGTDSQNLTTSDISSGTVGSTSASINLSGSAANVTIGRYGSTPIDFYSNGSSILMGISGLTSTAMTNWNDAYSWGDHAGLYSTGAHFSGSYNDLSDKPTIITSESDPVFLNHVSSSITAGDISEYEDAHSWGDHALENYLTSEVDGSTTNEIQSLSISGSVISLSGGGTVDIRNFSSTTGGLSYGTNNADISFTEGNIVLLLDASDNKFRFTGGNIVGTVEAPSDLRLKTNIQDYHSEVDRLMAVMPVMYEMKLDSTSRKHHGVIAQDLEMIYPEMVYTSDNGLKSVAYTELIAPMIKAIQEQQVMINDLKTEIEKLKK